MKLSEKQIQRKLGRMLHDAIGHLSYEEQEKIIDKYRKALSISIERHEGNTAGVPRSTFQFKQAYYSRRNLYEKTGQEVIVLDDTTPTPTFNHPHYSAGDYEEEYVHRFREVKYDHDYDSW